MRVANTHGCAVMVSGMPLPPARPARTSCRASRLYTAEQAGQTASRRLPQATCSTPPCSVGGVVDRGGLAGGQVDGVDAAAQPDRVGAVAGGGELAFPGAEVGPGDGLGVVGGRPRSRAGEGSGIQGGCRGMSAVIGSACQGRGNRRR